MSNPLAASASGTQANAPAGNSIAEVIDAFWVKQQLDMLEIDGSHDWRFHQLPLARIKKVMKLDDDAKNMMISAEVPILFAKACEFFILELTLRSWVHTEENKRRTLQKSDVAAALSRLDMYDFLIDIVPREDSSTHPSAAAAAGVSPLRVGMAAQQLGEAEDDEEYNPTE